MACEQHMHPTRTDRKGLVRAGPQAVSDYEDMLERNRAGRAAPSEDVAPRVPGNFYKTEEEGAGK